MALKRFFLYPFLLFILIITTRVASELVFGPISSPAMSLTYHVLWIFLFSWFSIQSVRLVKFYLLKKININKPDNLMERRLHTQIFVIEKILIVLIVISSAAFLLMSFDRAREIGLSLLASAGVAGIIVGLAAQKTLSHLIAGFQLALTQPIRLDDVVIVEGEWGRIEEITLTYVAINIWDKRRLIVPATYFMEKPFQNWTRVSADLLGSVFFFVDYSLPVEELRQKIDPIIQKCPQWDHQFWNLQVTDCSEKTMQLRILAGAKNSSDAWEMRCYLREKIIELIQRDYPQSLPLFRVQRDA